MQKVYLATIIALVILSVVQITGVVLGVWYLDSVLNAIPALIFSAMAGIFLWGLGKNIEKSLGKKENLDEEEKIPPFKPNSVFKDLVVFYYHEKGTPDTPDSSRLRYLVNPPRSNAYLLEVYPHWLANYIKNRAIDWHPFADERKLRKTIKEYKIYEGEILPSFVGLRWNANGLAEIGLYSNLLSELEGRKLEHLLLIRTQRRYFFSMKKRMFMVDNQRKQVWWAPNSWYYLVENHIIEEPQALGMYFYENCERWFNRTYKKRGFTYEPNYYPESLILATLPKS